MDARSRATRRRRRTPFPALLLLLLAAVLAACSSPAASASPTAVALAVPVARRDRRRRNRTPEPTASPTAAPAFPLTLTDDEGTEVTIPAEPTKIVSLTPAATETCSRSALGDRVVGKVEDFTAVSARGRRRPRRRQVRLASTSRRSWPRAPTS